MTRADEGARLLRAEHGARAEAECWRRLDDATAAHDHAAGIYWAEVAQHLRDARDAVAADAA